jgi:hypothetical protein
MRPPGCLRASGGDFLISASMIAQVIGRKPEC